MTVAYMDDLSRVRVTVTVPAGLTTNLTFQRTTDNIRWSIIRGGGGFPAAASSTVHIDDYEFPVGQVVTYRAIQRNSVGSQIGIIAAGSLTVNLDQFWIKSPTRTFLNREVDIRGYGDVTRASRTGVFEIVGRSFPVAVTDVRGSRQFTLDVRIENLGDANEFDLMLASGDVLYVQAPAPASYPLPGELFPSMFVAVGDAQTSRLGRNGGRIFSLPLTEVAPPHHTIVGTTVTWTSVVNAFATWADVIAAEATWADLMERIGEPTDVIVP